MRCKNCGWENPDGLTKCEKCNGSLNEASSVHNPTTPVSDRMRSTVSEGVIFNDQISRVVPKTCPQCGYPVSDTSTSCPNCNFELQAAPTAKQSQKCKACGSDIAPDAKFCSSCGAPVNKESAQPRKIQRSNMGTVMGGPIVGPASVNTFCTLKPIAWQGEDVNYNPITYSGDTIILNRANTDANNHSITSREQAVLTCED
ncbi:MAG: zinc ribbon domain-containing protein [Muribaculaceae bacterium]|nr:zinc ribbon domain-containing protein [Muribaculaceae bacterium]